MKKTKILIFFGIFFINLNAYAYLDPGSISLLVQGIIAGIAGFFGVIVLYWNKVKNLIKKIFRWKE